VIGNHSHIGGLVVSGLLTMAMLAARPAGEDELMKRLTEMSDHWFLLVVRGFTFVSTLRNY